MSTNRAQPDPTARSTLDLGAVPDHLLTSELVEPMVDDLVAQNTALVTRYLPSLHAVLDGAHLAAAVAATGEG